MASTTVVVAASAIGKRFVRLIGVSVIQATPRCESLHFTVMPSTS